MHVLPATVGLKNEDYCDFAVVYDHLLTPTAPENKTVKGQAAAAWGLPNGGGLSPLVNGGALIPPVGMPAITSPGQEQHPQPQTYAEAAAAAALAAGGTLFEPVTAPVVGMHNLIDIRKPSSMAWKYS